MGVEVYLRLPWSMQFHILIVVSLGQADISTLEPIEELNMPRGKTNKVLGVVPVL